MSGSVPSDTLHFGLLTDRSGRYTNYCRSYARYSERGNRLGVMDQLLQEQHMKLEKDGSGLEWRRAISLCAVIFLASPVKG